MKEFWRRELVWWGRWSRGCESLKDVWVWGSLGTLVRWRYGGGRRIAWTDVCPWVSKASEESVVLATEEWCYLDLHAEFDEGR